MKSPGHYGHSIVKKMWLNNIATGHFTMVNLKFF